MTIGTPDSARICRQTSMPSVPGSIRSSSTRSGLCSRNAASAWSPSAQNDGLEALAAQHDAEHLGQRGVVVDDQHASLHPRHAHDVIVTPHRRRCPPRRENDLRPRRSGGRTGRATMTPVSDEQPGEPGPPRRASQAPPAWTPPQGWAPQQPPPYVATRAAAGRPPAARVPPGQQPYVPPGQPQGGWGPPPGRVPATAAAPEARHHRAATAGRRRDPGRRDLGDPAATRG